MVIASSESTRTTDLILDGLSKVYKKKIAPVESAFKFDAFYSPPLSENELKAKPMILLLGQYSTGKTTFIQNVIGKEYPGGHVGPEPTTDKFVAVMHGEQDRLIPGNAAAVQANMPFGGLLRFGSTFLSKFQISETSSPILNSCILIDTPGVLSGDKQRLGRTFDFPLVCRWFAEHAALILVFFDAHKLDISDELKEVLEVLGPFSDKIRIILNKADQINGQELVRVYGALMWSLSKVIQAPEVPRVFIGTFRTMPLLEEEEESGKGREEAMLIKEEKTKILDELNRIPIDASIRKINELVKRARLARVHAIIINHLRNQMPSLFGKSSKQSKLIANLAGEFAKVQQEYNIPTGDLPELGAFSQKLETIDLALFPKLQSKQLCAIQDAVSIDIPNLMSKLALPANDQQTMEVKTTMTTFSDSSLPMQGFLGHKP